MQEDFNHFVKLKKRKKRFLSILLLTIVAAVSVVLMQECSQSFDEPYNKDYKPMDQSERSNSSRGSP